MKDQFQYTEFGLIPNDWILCKFKDALDTFSSGATPYRAIREYYEGHIRWVSSGELNYNIIYDTIEHISEKAVKNTNLRRHKAGTFLMAITGLEAEGTRGRCAILGDVSTTNQSCLALNGTDRLCVDFLFVFYKMWGDYLAFKYCQGSKQQSYTAQIARSLPIYFPPSIEEQQKIAEALRDIDLLIEGLKQKIAKKRAIKEGAMQQLLTGKKRLAGFSEPWVERRLGEVGAFISGSGFPILFQGNKTGELPFYKVSDFSNNGNTFYLNNANNYISHSTAKVLSCNIIPAKSIIFAKIGAAIFLERKRIAMTDCCIDNNMMALIINNGLNVNYINYVLQTIQFGDLVEVTALPSLGSKQLKRIKLFYPQCIIEQQAIAQILTDIDNEIAELEQKQKKYTTLKQGAMQKLLTGQIRL